MAADTISPAARRFVSVGTIIADKSRLLLVFLASVVSMGCIEAWAQSPVVTSGPPAAGNPAISVYQLQQHVAWRDSAGTI